MDPLKSRRSYLPSLINSICPSNGRFMTCFTLIFSPPIKKQTSMDQSLCNPLPVTSFFPFALLHTDTLDCLLSFLPHPLTRAYVLLQFDLADAISSCCLLPCTISIWHCDMILFILLYDTHLRATHTTTSSIGGVQIPIYLVSSTTDSLW